MEKKEIIMYEIDDCFGRLWYKYSKYANLYIAYPSEKGFSLIPFNSGAAMLKEHGSFGKTRREIRKSAIGADFYYYIEPCDETLELRERLKHSAVKFNLEENGYYKLEHKIYYIVDSLTKGLSKKELYKLRALGICETNVNVTYGDEGVIITFGNDTAKAKKLISVSDIKRIKDASLQEKLLSEDNLSIFKQSGDKIEEISLEDAVLGEKETKPRTRLFYEFDPLTEKNPGYGDTVELKFTGFFGDGSKVFVASPKILQHDHHFEYALRVKGAEIRVFNIIDDGLKGKRILEKIKKEGKDGNLRTFTFFKDVPGKKGMSYFIEGTGTYNKADDAKKMEFKADK